MRKDFFFIAAYSLLAGIYYSFIYVNPMNDHILLSELIIQLSGCRGNLPLSGLFSALIGFIAEMLPLMVLEYYGGSMIYKKFCISSVYVFSRCPNRKKWMISETVILFIYLLFANVLSVFIAVSISAIRFSLLIDLLGIYVLFGHVYIYSVWIFLICYSINVMSMYKGSALSFDVIMVIQFVLIGIIGIIEPLSELVNKDILKVLIYFNPISHLIIGWHKDVEELIYNDNSLFCGFASIKGSILYISLLLIVFVIIGIRLIDNKEVIANNMEGD